MQVPQATQLSVITCAIILLVFSLSIKIICDVTPALSSYIGYLSCFGSAKIQQTSENTYF